MIGKTLYKAKIVDGEITMSFYTIIGERGKQYKFTEGVRGVRGCFKSDVGVVFFLTKKEAMDYLIEEIKHSIKMGENYLKKTRSLLDDALNFPAK